MLTASSTAKKSAAPKIDAPKTESKPTPKSAPKATPTPTPTKTSTSTSTNKTMASLHRDGFEATPAPATKSAGTKIGTAQAGGTTPVAPTATAGTGGTTTIDDVVNVLQSGDTSDATRTMIHDYFAPLNMAESQAAMDRIRSEGLVGEFIDATARDEKGNPVNADVKSGLEVLFNSGRLDVYAETISSVSITVGTYVDKDGNPALQYNPGTKGIELDQTALNNLVSGGGAQNVANVLAHEMFHGFSDAHGGDGYSALDEGFGIAAREYAFSNNDYNLSEMIYGTKNWYRDLRNEPDYQFGDFSSADPKLQELMDAFASRDSSGLAWDNPTQLESEYQQFWEPLDRSDHANWPASANQATTDMIAARTNPPAPAPANPVQQFFDWLGSLFR